MRQPGELLAKNCADDFWNRIGRHWGYMAAADGVRAVDLLQSLSFVDPERIGVVGHSMACSAALLTMGYDQRVKAGIVSGRLGVDKYHPLFCPRLFMVLGGRTDGRPGVRERVEQQMACLSTLYKEQGCPENFMLRIGECEHYFLDSFKWEAFCRLKCYFGMSVGRKQSLLLADVMQDTLDAWGKKDYQWDDFADGEKRDLVKACGRHRVFGNSRSLVEAFDALFTVIKRKYGRHLTAALQAHSTKRTCEVTITVAGGSSESKGSRDWAIRDAERLFVENGASIRRQEAPNVLRYLVVLQKRADSTASAS